ncbi:uncharacterized protein LOC110462190, partial [Mizuhopecten yessoensis]|uniref:uncharacterized protein LOC110462190 n=1 Tax=Mizuhopecten yessoensis TaxID=6573 RepID=UPI000B45771F
MASSPLVLYTRLKTNMKIAYYTDSMVDNLANFRNEASAYLSGPGEYKSLPFLDICANLEGNGKIGWNNLENLKTIVQSASDGKEQLLEMINEAERKIQDNLSGSACCLPPEMGAQKRKLRADEMVVYMEEKVYRVKEGYAAFLDCYLVPKPVSVVWKKGEENKVDKIVPINNKKYYCAGPSSPALVIRRVEKRDEAYYQCTAKYIDTTRNIEIEIQGDAVPLELDSDEDRRSNTHSTQRSQSLSASGAGGSHSHINIRSSASSQDWQRESPSYPTEDRQQGPK